MTERDPADRPSPEEVQAAALRALAGPDGPVRFAVVAAGIYRGGHPSATHLERLAELGVRTIISLRREDGPARRLEEARARALGLRFLHFPSYGIFGISAGTLAKILEEVRP